MRDLFYFIAVKLGASRFLAQVYDKSLTLEITFTRQGILCKYVHLENTSKCIHISKL